MVFALLPIALVAVVVLVFAWIVTARDVRAAPTLGSRQTVALIGLFASTALVPLPYLMVPFVDPHNQRGLAWAMRMAVLLFVLSLPGAFAQKGLLRWGLVLSSIFFLGFTGLVYAISGWQF